MENLEVFTPNIIQKIQTAPSLEALEGLRLEILGKKGSLTLMMQSLGTLSGEERKEQGKILNETKVLIQEALQKARDHLEYSQLEHQLRSETLDITLPTRPLTNSRIHPISQVMDELTTLFGRMGFTVADGPDVEEDFYNFEALNIPPHHPARQDQDTFYMTSAEKDTIPKVLRTQTSSVQIRTMMKEKPPLKIISMGRVFRSDYDITHTPMFHQIEGLMIGKDITMGHLKGCLMEFLKEFFQVDDLPIRLRPSFFPFTEPSAEVDIGCTRENGAFKIGAGNDWLEILGCGMVHPNVLKNCNLDPNEYQGFAFGMGIERITMLKYGISDLRTFFESDLRWLKYYGFSALNIPSSLGGASS